MLPKWMTCPQWLAWLPLSLHSCFSKQTMTMTVSTYLNISHFNLLWLIQMNTLLQVFKHFPCSPWVKTTKWHWFHHLNLHLIRWRALFVVASHWLDLKIESHYRRLQLDNDLSAVLSFFLLRKEFIWMGLAVTDWEVPNGEQCHIDSINLQWPFHHSLSYCWGSSARTSIKTLKCDMESFFHEFLTNILMP